MIRYRPRSIVSLILIGFVVVLTPCIAAVVTAVVRIDSLAQDSRSAVLSASAATEHSRVLVDQAIAMQRAIGQYSISSGDRDYYRIYLERRMSFRQALNALIGLDAAGLDRTELNAVAESEQNVFNALGGQRRTFLDAPEWSDAIDSLADVTERSRAMLVASDRLVARQANDTVERAESLQRNLLALTAVAAPATLLLAGLFAMLITRPMRAVGDAIRQLGAQSFDEPITVVGPRDIEALGTQLDWLRRRMRSLEEQKTNFLRHISHELKTPLTTIREGSELLTESLDEDSPEEAEIARLMRDNGLHLQRLIEDLLEFARTQELVADLELRDDVDLVKLIRLTIATQAVASDAKNVTIDQELASVRIRGDADKLRIVVDNLLANAIKYTPRDGRIVIGLTEHGGLAIIDVQDTGPGVDGDEVDEIFEPFRQGRAKYQSSVKGTGLGLAIAKEYVEAHDGDIEVVDSKVGAHIRVRLPLGGPQAEPRNSTAHARPRDDAARRL